MPTSFNESIYRGEFLLSEANGYQSREAITVVSGQNLAAGSVLGKITASGKYKIYDPAASDGSQTVAAVLYGAVDATGGDAKGTIIARNAEVKAASLTWFSGASSPQIATGRTGLAALGIIARD